METAVTIPNEIFQQAESLAGELGLSRNELYAQALSRLLKTHQDKARRDEDLTRQLNEIYAEEDSSLDPVLMQMQLTALDPGDW